MVEDITPAELHQRIEAGDAPQVVDVRPPAAFAAGHIPGAVNLSLDEFTARVDEFDWGEEVVFACPLGESSLQAGRLLESFEGTGDATVYNLVGGYDAWAYDLEEA